MADEYVVDFPALWVAVDWLEHHCVIPDGFRRGQPFRMYDWQLWCTVNHYRVTPDSPTVTETGEPIKGTAFVNRRSQVIAPQKVGKGPWSAAIICLEAVGPALFKGWASGGEQYRCDDHGCSCGWVYTYREGEPMGQPWPTPLVQLMATSEGQVANVYRPLQSMIRAGRLSDTMKIREGFIRLPNDGRIDVVTSSVQRALGNPSTFVLQDETGLYLSTNKLRDVADTQLRSLAGMQGRGLETTNCFNPAENSTAQTTYEAKVTDIFRHYREPPKHLDYLDAEDRAQIHAFNYAPSPHTSVASIEPLALELIERDPQQAERFFGNRMVRGAGVWLPDGLWDSAYAAA